ncbi:MAG: hypothetical protein V3R83_07990 [Gammaproteobacteria bacterium]
MIEFTVTDERMPVARAIPPLKVNALSPAVQATISRQYRQMAFCHGIHVTGAPATSSRKIRGGILNSLLWTL